MIKRALAFLFDGDESAELTLGAGRLGYVHLARGAAVVNGRDLAAGDALLYKDEASVVIGEGRDADVLVFDLPRL